MSGNAYISSQGGSRIPLELENVDDSFGNALVQHEYPNSDGADLENQGRTPRRVRLKAIFWDEPNHIGYDNHFALIQVLDAKVVELNHPVYGLLKGMVGQINVRHDDTERYAEVEFEFVEQGRSDTVAVQVVDVVASMENGFEAALDAELTRIEADARDAAEDDYETIVEVDLSDVPAGDSILDRFYGVSRAAWEYVKQADAALRAIEGTLIEVAAPANSLVATVSFSTNLPGRILSSVANCVERYATLGESLYDSPFRFCDSLKAGLLQLEAAVPAFSSQVRSIGAARCCLALGEIFDADDQTWRANAANVSQPAFDPKGNRRPTPAPTPTLSTLEMENAAALLRTWVQEAVDLDRTRTELKVMARDLTSHISEVKLQRENLVSVRIDQPMPLHLVCLKQGLDYRDADRLLAVNRIRKPNFVEGDILVYG